MFTIAMSVYLQVITNVPKILQNTKSPLTSGGIWNAKGIRGQTVPFPQLIFLKQLYDFLLLFFFMLCDLKGLVINCIFDYKVSHT